MTTLRKRINSQKESEFQVKLDHSRSFSSFKGQTPVSAINMAQSRTDEFKSVVDQIKARSGNDYRSSQPREKNLDWSNFMKIAKHIGKDISGAFTKLEKLTLLAQQRSLFNDKPSEIQSLSYIIKEDISRLNKQIAQLQELSKNGHYKYKKQKEHSNSIVVSLQSKLASMSNDFREVLEVRTENLLHQKNRSEQFTQGPIASTLPASATSGHTGSVLLSDDQECRINMGDNYQQQMQLIDEQDSYIQNRTETMQSIEATIVELGSIFQQLAHMVKEQEDMVQRIDSNTEEANMNVEAAHSEILKYFQTVTSNRYLMIKIFAVLIVFFIIFVVFVA